MNRSAGLGRCLILGPSGDCGLALRSVMAALRLQANTGARAVSLQRSMGRRHAACLAAFAGASAEDFQALGSGIYASKLQSGISINP